MIFLDRTLVQLPPNLDLNNANSPGSKEKKEAERRSNTSNPMKSEDFKAYSHPSVREALTTLSHRKCAYCESEIAGSSQTDIEHFRPKGAVTELEGHPGYYWLAMEWTNLVLACMHCNQSRRQLIIDDDATVEEIREALESRRFTTTGKKNSFPTLDGHWVTTHLEDVHENEKPALINPSKTDPEGMFEWIFSSGKIVTMKGLDPEGRAQTTIDVLGLNRRYLTESRMTRQLLLNRHAHQIQKFLRQFLEADSKELEEVAIENLKDELETLRGLGEPIQPFSSMSRSFHQRQLEIVRQTLQ